MDIPWVVIPWGVVVGMDLVVGPQIMIARPLVAALLAGFLTGDPRAGLWIGVAMELAATEILPVGGARYPDYGVGAVAGTIVAAGSPDVFGFGAGLLVAFVVAALGDVGMHLVRVGNTRDVRNADDRLAQGDLETVRSLQRRGAVRELARVSALMLLAVGLNAALRFGPVPSERTATGLLIVGAGVVLGTGLTGGLRLAGRRGAMLWWYLSGLGLGLVWVVLL